MALTVARALVGANFDLAVLSLPSGLAIAHKVDALAVLIARVVALHIKAVGASVGLVANTVVVVLALLSSVGVFGGLGHAHTMARAVSRGAQFLTAVLSSPAGLARALTSVGIAQTVAVAVARAVKIQASGTMEGTHAQANTIIADTVAVAVAGTGLGLNLLLNQLRAITTRIVLFAGALTVLVVASTIA